MLIRSSASAHDLPIDPLSEVLQDLRLANASYGRCELSRPWGIEFPPRREAGFHFIASGECWLKAPDRGWLPLVAGDVALLPHGSGHVIADSADGPTRPLAEMPLEEIGDRMFAMRAGGNGARALLMCCSVAFEAPAIHPLLELMPPLLLVRAGEGSAPLPALLDTMAREVTAPRVGTATVLTRLADAVIATIVRAFVEARRGDTQGWLAAIRDPRIGRALGAIHREPQRDWSVDALAELASLSRSTFSERFAAVVGVPPARYVARWRMHLASALLKRERLSVGEVAHRLGYESEPAFSRAFKRLVGVPPGAVRRG